MASLLLPVIYLAFISLGLPDALLGAAWPNMYQELGASVSWAGIISMIISAGTVVSSLASDRLYHRFGAGKVTAFSVMLTALALFGFSISRSFIMLCIIAVPYGLGAGSVDAVLNNYVALHYKARHMSWLHCMWGVGCSIGPMIMGQALAHSTWNDGYRIISMLQVVLTLIIFISLPLWKKNEATTLENHDNSERSTAHHPIKEFINKPGVKAVCLCFFCYCALETTMAMWAASYCTLFRGIPAQQATEWASLFYIGITAGRFASGFITLKVNEQNMIRMGQALIAVGLIMIALPLGDTVLLFGLIVTGIGCAPIYPSIIHETPANFGPELSQAIIGTQMACAYIGTCLVPTIFGYLAEHISFALYPLYAAVLLVIMIAMSERLHTATKAHRIEYRKSHAE